MLEFKTQMKNFKIAEGTSTENERTRCMQSIWDICSDWNMVNKVVRWYWKGRLESGCWEFCRPGFGLFQEKSGSYYRFPSKRAHLSYSCLKSNITDSVMEGVEADCRQGMLRTTSKTRQGWWWMHIWKLCNLIEVKGYGNWLRLEGIKRCQEEVTHSISKRTYWEHSMCLGLSLLMRIKWWTKTNMSLVLSENSGEMKNTVIYFIIARLCTASVYNKF